VDQRTTGQQNRQRSSTRLRSYATITTTPAMSSFCTNLQDAAVGPQRGGEYELKLEALTALVNTAMLPYIE
jgi:hypothetical protein